MEIETWLGLTGRERLALAVGRGMMDAAQLRRDAEWLEVEGERLAAAFTSPSLGEEVPA